MKTRGKDRDDQLPKPCVGKLPVHLHKTQDRGAHAFQSESVNCFYINVASLTNKMDELRKLSNANNAHLKGISETWISYQFTHQELVLLGMSLFRNERKSGSWVE